MVGAALSYLVFDIFVSILFSSCLSEGEPIIWSCYSCFTGLEDSDKCI